MKERIAMVLGVWMGLSSVGLAATNTWVQEVSHQGETIRLRLTRQDLRGPNFELWAQNATGGYDVITPVAERSYLGTVDEYPAAVSCGIIQDDGVFKGAVYFDRGSTWFTLDTAVTGTRGLSQPSTFGIPSYNVTPGQAGTTMYGFDVGVDARYEYYTDRGATNLAQTVEAIEYSVTLTRALYMHDALLRPYLGRVIIRTDATQDPYAGLTGGDYLGALRTEWNTNHGSADRDVVTGVAPSHVWAGLAWVGVIGTSSAYSVNDSSGDGNFSTVWRHEMGHNWGLGHYDGGAPEGATINSGNQYARMSGPELYKVLNHRNNKLGVLDNEGTYTAVDIPPYATIDSDLLVQVVDTQASINVVANDHDANGDALSILSFDATTANGGTVVQQGNNLVYTAGGSFLGTDSFAYVVEDASGQTATGVVSVDVQPNDALRLYLPLDETDGTLAADYSSFSNDGTTSTDLTTLTAPGAFAQAVNLDGADDHVEVPGVNMNSDTVTLTAWIKQGATQNDWAGIIFDRSGGAAGLSISDTGDLRYHWNNSQWWVESDLVPPADTWTFVALTVSPSRAVIYMNSGSGFQTRVNNAAHAPAFFGTTHVGWDSTSSARHFQGAIDDVRVYSHAMTPSELQRVYAGGAAGAPVPFDGATDVTLPVLGWAPGATATSFEVYVGTSEAAVAAATTASPEYQGATTSPDHIAALVDQTTYFWRIDTVTASTTLPGIVWSFTTGSLPPPGDSILVNFEENVNQHFAGGQLIGPTSVDSANWNAGLGASGSLSNLIDNVGVPTGVGISWQSSVTWYNHDGLADDEHKMSVGYLDDGNIGSGKGATVTLTDIPFAVYRVYGLFATDQNQGSGSSCGIVNVRVNGTWALGGNASTTAAAWGTIGANHAHHGEYWTEIERGSVQGNYWTVETGGPTCTIVSEDRNGSNRGTLTAVIIEDMTPPPDNDGDGIPDETDPDDDNDGIPDAWETAHGLDPLVDDRAGDPDLDGDDNEYEYAADTDPRDDTSFQTFSIELAPGSGDPAVRFRSSSNRHYAVEHRADLTAGTWEDLDSVFPGSGSEMTVEDASGGPAHNYRLRIEVP